MFTNQEKGHGYFRKSKAYGLVSGIALAAAFLGSVQTISADEVTSPPAVVTTAVAEAPAETVVTTSNPATNLVEAQPATSPEATQLSQQSGTQTGELISPVNSQELTNALDKAEEANVTVTVESTPVAHTSLEAAENDLSAQVHEVEQATAKKEDNTQAIKEAEEKNAEIDRQNKAEEARVAERNRQGQAEVAARNKAGQEAVDQRNKKELDRRDDEAKAVEARNKAGQAAVDADNRRGQAQVEERNRLGQAAVDGRNKQGQALVDERNQKGQAEIDARNLAQQEIVQINEAARREAEEYNRQELERVEREWQAALAKWERDQDEIAQNALAYKEAKAKYDAAKAEYDKKVAEIKAQKDSAVSSNGSTVYLTGTVNEAGAGSLAYFDDMQALFFPAKEVSSLVDGSFYWGDNTRLTSLKNAEVFTDPGKVDSPTDFMMQNFKVGTTFTIENVGVANGESLNFSAKVIVAKGIPQGTPNIMTIGKDGTTQAFRFVVYNTAEVEIIFDIVTASGTKIYTGVSSIVGDLDYGQSSRLTIGEETASFIPPNSGISKEGDKFVSDGQAANDFASTPLGTYLVAGLGDSITYYHSGDSEYINQDQATRDSVAAERWNSGHPLNGFAFNIFGKGVSLKNTWIPVPPVPPKLNVIEIPRPEKGKPNLKEVPPVKTFEPETFVPETFTPETFTPETFTPKTFTPEGYNPPPFVPEVFTPETYTPLKPVLLPHVAVPAKELVTVATHPVLVKQKPQNQKTVLNADGESVDGQLVTKGDWHTWVLTNDNLKAGREELKDYFMRDPFPSGTEIDWETSLAQSPGWLRSIDESGLTLISANRETLNRLNANRQLDVTVPAFNLVFRPLNDGGTYENTFETFMVTAKGNYRVVSNTPVVYTPGNDPKTPRPPRVPGGETPTPNDNLIQPKKAVVDEKGQSIDGKSVLPNTQLNYVATQDFDQYKGMSASGSAIAKGFLYVDDYLDAALDGKSMVVNSLTATNGDDVTSLFDMIHVLSKEALDVKLQELIQTSGISPVGEFYLWVAKDPAKFFEAYVQKGLSITRDLTFKLKEGYIGEVTNQTFQVDFGNGYYGNVVTNHVPKLEADKDALEHIGTDKSLNNAQVSLGQVFPYRLKSPAIPMNLAGGVKEVKLFDDLDEKHDRYDGEFYAFLSQNLGLKDGKALVANEEFTKHIRQVLHRDEKGTVVAVDFLVDETFLSQIKEDQVLEFMVYPMMTRIAYGENIKNEVVASVNGVEVSRSSVVTHTPKPTPPAPEVPVQPATPTPQPPAPATPAPGKPTLPNTGEGAGVLMAVSGALTSLMGLLGLSKRKND